MIVPGFLESILSSHALLAFFLFTLLYSFSLPICEEIALIIVGMLAHKAGVSPVLAALVAYPGIFGSDVGYYWLARRFGGGLLRSRFFSRIVSKRKVFASELYFKHRGPRIAFFCRFVVGLRASAMIAAGMLHMPFRLFALYDGLAATLSTVFWLGLGFFWGDMLASGLSIFGKVAAIATPIGAVAILGLFYLRIRSTYRDLERQASAPGASQADEAGLKAAPDPSDEHYHKEAI